MNEPEPDRTVPSRILANLEEAYYWECPSCRASNYERPQIMDLSIEEKEEAYRVFYQLEDWVELPDDWSEFHLQSFPTEVECRHCKNIFPTMEK